MNLSPAELAVFGTLGGAFIGAMSAIITSFINKYFEGQKYLREQIIRTSIEYWQKHHELIRAANNGKLSQVVPLDSYLIHVTAIMSEIMNKKITPDNIVQLIENAHKISKLADTKIREEK